LPVQNTDTGSKVEPGLKARTKVSLSTSGYIAGTTEFGIVYPKYTGSNNKLVGYSDSDFVGDVDDRKSTTRVIFSWVRC
jgi:hypothetical protein